MLDINQFLADADRFLRKDLWRLRTEELSGFKSWWIRVLKIFLLAVHGIARGKTQLRASALTFYTLLSIVPVAAMGFGIAKGFGLEKHLEQELLAKFPEQDAMVHLVVNFSNSLLENTKGGLIAGIGVLLLIWAIIKVLGHTELAFNNIWKVRRARSYVRKFADYTAIVLVSPLLLVISGSATVFIRTQFETLAGRNSMLQFFGPVVTFFLSLLPYLLLWVLFTMVYLVIPNTRVRFAPALIAGIITGTIFQVVQLIYIGFQVGVAKYNAIYGSFAALPLLLIWLQLSWLIVLFGAQLTYAIQHVDEYGCSIDTPQLSSAEKRLASLLIAHHIIKNFIAGAIPLAPSRIARDLDIPVRVVRMILREFVQSGLFAKAAIGDSKHRTTGVQPAVDVNQLTVTKVLGTLDRTGGDCHLPQDPARTRALQKILAALTEAVQNSPANKLIKDI